MSTVPAPTQLEQTEVHGVTVVTVQFPDPHLLRPFVVFEINSATDHTQRVGDFTCAAAAAHCHEHWVRKLKGNESVTAKMTRRRGESKMNRNDESRGRSLARRRGYVVRKSRQWKHVPHSNNHGEYMLIDPFRNIIVLGERFNASHPEVAYNRHQCGFVTLSSSRKC